MKTRTKRFLAMLLVIVMVFGMMPVGVFASENAPFSVSVGEAAPAEGLMWTDWMGNASAVPCYQVTVPEGTASVTLTFDGEKQCCYYDAAGNWIGYIGGDENMTAAAEHTVALQDSNSDGVLDGVSVQTPNTYATDYYVAFAYGSASGSEEPEVPFTEIKANGSALELGTDILYKGMTSFTSLGGTKYKNIPYYEIQVPQGTEKVYATYARSDFRSDEGLDAVTSATISGYSATVTEKDGSISLSNPGGPALQATGDNKTYTTVEIPVASYVITDGAGKVITPQTATTFEPVVFFGFSYTDEVLSTACLKVLEDAPTAATSTVGGLYKLNLNSVFADSEGHDITYSFESTVENEHTKISDGVFYFSAGETGTYDVTLTAKCGAAEISHKLTMTVEKASEGIEAQYGYDETDKSSVTVYVTVSNDGYPIMATDGSVMSNMKVTVPYFDLGLYGLESYYRYGTDGGRGVYTTGTVIQRPTGLHLYIYLLERYYMGLDESECCLGAASGVLNFANETEVYYMDGEKAYDSNGKKALYTTGGACSIYMVNFWGHDENLMYYRNHCYPYMNPGWGSTSDYILLSDGDAWEVAMFTNWGFYHTGYFASFDQDVYEADPGASVTAFTQKWGTTAEAKAFEAVNGSDGLSVGLYDSEWNQIQELAYDADSGNTITFTAPEEAGTYYLMALDPNAKDGEDAKIAPATARVVVGGESEGVDISTYYDAYDFLSVKDDQGRYLVDIKAGTSETQYNGTVPTHQITVEEGTETVYVTFPAGKSFVQYTGTYSVSEAVDNGYGRNVAVTANEDGTVTVAIPIEAYTDTDTGVYLEDGNYSFVYGFDFKVGTITKVEVGQNTPVSRILLNSYAETVVYNKEDKKTAQLTATVLPAEATGWTISWSSSDETVATVDGNGLVTGLAEGTAVITAAIGDVKAECTVTVEKYNTAPAVASGVPSWMKIADNSTVALDVSEWFTDEQNDAITYTAKIQKANSLSASKAYGYVDVEGPVVEVDGTDIQVTVPDVGVYMLNITASDGKDSKTHGIQLSVSKDGTGPLQINEGITLEVYNIALVGYTSELREEFDLGYNKGVWDATVHHLTVSKDNPKHSRFTPDRKLQFTVADGYSWGQNGGATGGSAREDKNAWSSGGDIGFFAKGAASDSVTAHYLMYHWECATHTDADKNQICDSCWLDISCETCTDENADKICDVCGKVLNKLPYIIEGVKDKTVIVQTGHSYQLHDVSGGLIFTDDDDTLTYENYKMRKSSDGGASWGEWENAFKALDHGGISDSVVNSTEGIYVYQFKAFDGFGESEDVWTLTLDTRDVVPANVSFYLGRDHQYNADTHAQLPVLELYVTAGIDENLFDYVGWFVKDGQTVYVYDPSDYQITDGENDFVTIDGIQYELHGYEKVTFTNSAFDASDETAAASGTVVDNYNMFYATVETGRYSTRVYGYNAESGEYDVYLGGQSMELPREKDIYGNGGTDIYLRQVNVYTTSKKLDGTYFTADDYHAEMIMPITGSMIYSGDPYVSGNYTYYPFFSWAAGNGSLYNCYVYPHDTDSYIFTQAINNTTSAGYSVVNKSMTINTAVELKATVPADGDFGLYLQYNNFNTREIEPYGEAVTNGDGTKTVTYKVSKGNGNYTWRLTDPSGAHVTKAGWIKCTADTEKTFTFSQFTDKASHDFSQLGTQVDTRDEADIQVFLSDTGFKSVSETTRIRAYRMWQIIDTDSMNIMIEPDFNIQVLQGNPDDFTYVSGGNVTDNWIDAMPTTTDIVAVNYDALEVLNTSDTYGSHGGFYPATNPERTNVFVITNETAGTAAAHVAFNGSKETDRGTEWDYNYDTWFYLSSEEAPMLDFTVSGTGDVDVSYATVITDASLKSTLSGWTAVAADENGSYYADLLKFRSAGAKGGTVIIKMTDSTGTSYALVRVAEFTADVTNVSNPGEPFMPGDQVSVTFDGLYRSINKISGVFNPLKYQLRYTSAGTEISGSLAQYQQMDRTSITLTIPADLEFAEGQDTVDYTFTNGYVYGTMYSASSPFGTMYYMTDTGMGTNFSAVGTEYVLSRVADIPITVQKKVAYDVKIQVTDGENVLDGCTFELTGPDGTVLTADENGIYQDLGFGDYSYSLSKKGYIGRNDSFHLGSANMESVVDGILTLTFAIDKAPEGAWDGETYTEPDLVDGVYQISNGAELAWFAQTVNAGSLDISAVLTRDIDLAGYNWAPIGNSKAKFSGTFDGQGHKVTHFVIIDEAYASGVGAGLFGYGDGCAVENLTVEGSISLTSSASVSTAYAGGVLGGGANVTLTNVHSAVDITVERVKGNWARVGGVFGGGSCETVTDCSYTGTLNGYQYCGGIVGYITGGTVSGCYNAGTVNAVSTYAAGIVGSNSGGNTVACYNVGTVTANGNYAGGIAASSSSGALTNCFNLGTVSAADYAGAIAGNITKDTATVIHNYYLEGTCASGFGTFKGTPTAEAVTAETLASSGFVASVNAGLEPPAFVRDRVHPVFVWQATPAVVTLTADKETVAAGEEITLTLSLDKPIDNAYLWQWNIMWNGQLFEAVSMTAGDAHEGSIANMNATTSLMTPYEASAITSGNTVEIHELNAGTLATLTLRAKTAITDDAEAKFYADYVLLETGMDGVEYQDIVTECEWGVGYDSVPTEDADCVRVLVTAPEFIPVSGIALDKSELALTEGETAVLSATVDPAEATDKTVTWTSSDESVAVVDENGNVTAIGSGTAVITASAGDVSASCTVTVRMAIGTTQVKASNVASSGKIKLTWDAVEGAVQYKIYRATKKDGTYKVMYTTSGTSYTNTKAAAGKYYYYYVTAIAADGTESAPSAIVGRTCDLARPVVTASNVAKTGKVKLTWEAVEGAVAYKVYRATSKDGTYSLMKTTETTAYTNTKAEAGVTYYYKVVAVAAKTAANSAASAIKSRTCDLARPVASVSLNSKGKPVVTWDAVEGATKYTVYIYDASGELLKTANVTGTKLTHGSAVKGTTYRYRAVAKNAVSAAASAQSTAVSIKSK